MLVVLFVIVFWVTKFLRSVWFLVGFYFCVGGRSSRCYEIFKNGEEFVCETVKCVRNGFVGVFSKNRSCQFD